MTDYEPIALAALALAIVALIVAIAALSLWIGHKLSTHRIEWRTIKMDDAQDAKTLAEKLNAPYEEEEYDSL